MVDGVSGVTMEIVQLPVEVDVRPDTELAPTQHQHMVDMNVQDMPQKKSPVMITTAQVLHYTYIRSADSHV